MSGNCGGTLTWLALITALATASVAHKVLGLAAALRDRDPS